MAALVLPLLLGLLAALFPPKRAWPVVLASVPILGSGWLLLSAFGEAGLLRWQWEIAGVLLSLRLNGLSVLLLLTTQGIGVAAALYTPGHLRLTDPAPLARWLWPLMGIVISALSLIWLATDLLTLYAALELMGLAAVGMLMLSGKVPALVAGMRYLLLALVGSLTYLLGVALIFRPLGPVGFTGLSGGNRTRAGGMVCRRDDRRWSGFESRVIPLACVAHAGARERLDAGKCTACGAGHQSVAVYAVAALEHPTA